MTDELPTTKRTFGAPVSWEIDPEPSDIRKAIVALADAIQASNWSDRERHLALAYKLMGVPFV